MSVDERTLQIEVTVVPPKGRRSGPRRGPAGAQTPDPPPIPRIRRLMALAIKFQEMVDRGEVRDYADLARLGYVSRARITQIMNLLQLAPDIQEHLLSEVAARPIAERHIRHIASIVEWSEQRLQWNAERS